MALLIPWYRFSKAAIHTGFMAIPKKILAVTRNNSMRSSSQVPDIVKGLEPMKRGRPKKVQESKNRVEPKKILRVAMLGEPNAGKSTLVNAFIGEKVTIVSDINNTTRENIYVPFEVGNTQLVFIDTPGIVPFQEARRLKLGRQQITAPRRVIDECDMLAVVVDLESRRKRERIHECILDLIHKQPDFPCILILNKIDLVKRKSTLLRYASILTNDRKKDVWGYEPNGGFSGFKNVFMVSGSNGDGIDDVVHYLLASAKDGDWEYEGDVKVDLPIDRQISELFRETILELFKHEIPWQMKQTTLLFEEIDSDIVRIHQKLIWPKKSQARFVKTRSEDIENITRKKLAELLNRKIMLTVSISSSISLARNLPF